MEQLTEEVLRKGLAKARDIRVEVFDKLFDSEHVFSEEFEIKMNRLLALKKQNTNRRVWKRIAAIVILVLSLGMATVMSVKAFRDNFYELVEKVYDKFSKIIYHQVAEEPGDNGRFVEYELGSIPTNYKLKDSFVDESAQIRSEVYTDGERLLHFRQFNIHNTDFTLNTEDSAIEDVEVDGIEMHYLEKDGDHTIFFDNGKYVFLLSGEVDKETLMETTKSIQIKK